MRIFSGMATFRFRLKGSTEWITGLTLEDKPFTIEPIINKFQVKTDYSQSVYKELLNSVDYAVEMGISMTDSIFLTFNSSKIYEGDLVVMTVEGDLLFRFDDISLTVKQHFDFKKSVTNYIEISGITKNDFVLLDPHVVPNSVTFTTVPDTPLNISDTFQLAWTVEPWYAPQQVTFRSSNEGVLTVDENGLVTAITEGTADITVTTINEKTDTTTIECLTHTHVMTSALFDNDYRCGYDQFGNFGILVPTTAHYNGIDFGVRNIFFNVDGGCTFDLVDNTEGFLIPDGSTFSFKIPKIDEEYLEVVDDGGDVDVFIWQNKAMSDYVFEQFTKGEKILFDIRFLTV